MSHRLPVKDKRAREAGFFGPDQRGQYLRQGQVARHEEVILPSRVMKSPHVLVYAGIASEVPLAANRLTRV